MESPPMATGHPIKQLHPLLPIAVIVRDHTPLPATRSHKLKTIVDLNAKGPRYLRILQESS